jgi:hypothetical protein
LRCHKPSQCCHCFVCCVGVGKLIARGLLVCTCVWLNMVCLQFIVRPVQNAILKMSKVLPATVSNTRRISIFTTAALHQVSSRSAATRHCFVEVRCDIAAVTWQRGETASYYCNCTSLEQAGGSH